MKNLVQIFLIIALGIAACSEEQAKSKSIQKPKERTPNIAYTVDTILPHSTNSFTEGFFVLNGEIFESTGSPEYFPSTRSVYGSIDLNNGEIEVVNELPQQYFGEGITVLNNKLYQLTYQSQKGFIWDWNTGEELGTFNIPAIEGWGFANDGKHLIMSDGTEKLRFINPTTMKVDREIQVKENGKLIERLNELEYVKGKLYANVFMADLILRIDPQTGKVLGKLDISDLKRRALYEYPKSQESNGIAYDEQMDMYYVTGKMWPFIFRIQLLD